MAIQHDTMCVCTACHSPGHPIERMKGSGLVELVLFLIFVIAGLLFLAGPFILFSLFPAIAYSIWRRTTGAWTCQICGSEQIIPMDSPRGLEIYNAANPPVENVQP